MPAPSDPQSPSDRNESPLTPESEGSNAARLLEEIRERMERLEGHLSLRERRLVRIERALREADAKLQAERARFSQERDSVEKGLSQRLQDRERQLEESARAVQEHQARAAALAAREREFAGRVAQLTRERDATAGELASVRTELAEQQRKRQELESQIEDIHRRRAEWEAAATSAVRPPAATRALLASALDDTWRSRIERRIEPVRRWWQKLTPGQKATATTAAVALPVMCLLVAITAFVRHPATYRVAGWVTAQPRDAKALAGMAAEVPAPAGVEIRAREAEAVVEFVATTRDREAAARAVDSASLTLLDKAAALATRPASPPERVAQRDMLLNRLRELDVSSTRPAVTDVADTRPAPPADPETLLASWQTALNRRKSLADELSGLAAQLNRKPPEPGTIQPSTERLQAALAGDSRLQADTDVLGQREGQLADALRRAMDAARPAMDGLTKALADTDTFLAETLKSPQDQDVAESLQVIRTALGNWGKAAGSLARTWQDERAALDKGTAAEPSARQAAVETSVRQFQEGTGNSLALLQKALDAIGQGGDEPTKRLVLRNGLAQKLQPALEARDALLAGVRQATAAGNVELANLAQNINGLRGQVKDRRARIEEALRQVVRAEAQTAYENDMATLRARRDEATRKAAELDATILQHSNQAFALLRDSRSNESSLSRQAMAARLRAETLAQIRALEEADAADAASLPPPVVLHRVPAQAIDVTSAAGRVGRAGLAGLVPLLLAALLAGIVFGVRAWRESGESVEAYAKALRNLPRRRSAEKVRE